MWLFTTFLCSHEIHYTLSSAMIIYDVSHLSYIWASIRQETTCLWFICAVWVVPSTILLHKCSLCLELLSFALLVKNSLSSFKNHLNLLFYKSFDSLSNRSKPHTMPLLHLVSASFVSISPRVSSHRACTESFKVVLKCLNVINS